MRACMVAYTFYEGDNRVRRYAESLVRRGDSVDVISLSHPNHHNYDIIHGVKVYAIQKRETNEKHKFDYFLRTTLFLIKSFLFLTKMHLKNRYQLIHVHSVPDYEVFAALIPKLMGAKIILDIHDIVPEFYAGKFNHNKTSLVFKILILAEKLCCAFSDHVIISNDIWAEKLISRSVKKSKCTTILNYPDPFIFKKHNIPKDVNAPFTLIYPGSLNWHQGLDIAIKAIEIVKNEIPKVQLHIYGRGPEKDNLIVLTEKLKLSENVKFFGLLSIEEVALKMEAADAGVVPKRADGFGNEAFSTKVFEFMMLGVPVIVSKTKIDRFYFNDKLVIFFEPENEQDLALKILSCIRDQKTRETLVNNSLIYIKDHLWDVKSRIYFNLINSLLTKQ